jgi:hypothetical protein
MCDKALESDDGYPLVNIQKSMSQLHFKWEN